MWYLAFSIINKDQTSSLPKIDASKTPTELGRILTLTFIIIGAVSLMLLVISGFRYTISGGDATKVADTKRAILYTFIGLIISAMAAVIVNAVLNQTSVGK